MKPRKASLSKTALLAMIILSVALILGLAQQSSADPTHYVDDGTCPDPGSGTSGDPYCKIQDGIDSAAPTDTVLVADGTYNEGIIMKDGVDVESVNGQDFTFITGSAGEAGKAAVVVFSSADGAWTQGATLSGFTIGYAGGGAGAGIFVEGPYVDPAYRKVVATVDHCVIDNNPGGAGVRLNGLVNATITNCIITRNTKAGIVTRSAAQLSDQLETGSIVTILGNTIGGSGNGNKFGGIILNGAETTPNNILVTIGGSDLGQPNTISFNTRQSVDGKGGAGIRLWRINSVSIVKNTISDNDRGGIVLIDVANGNIEGNEIYNHDTEAGINIGGASGVAPSLSIGPGNQIHNNYAGIAFYAGLNTSLDASMQKTCSGTVTIGGTDWATNNVIHSNEKAGIAVIDPVSGQINIQFNEIYGDGAIAQKAGIAFFNGCEASITDNEIHGHSLGAGIFTGDWSGNHPPDGGSGFDTTNNVSALLTIERNKVYSNDQAGMRLDHASGTISNNLVYSNGKAGIRFSGGDAGDSPLGVNWGITAITNNTVADNGTSGIGGGIVYDDISDTTSRQFLDGPPQGSAWDSTHLCAELGIRNNISASNATAGIRVGCNDLDSAYFYNIQYNLLYDNYEVGACDGTEPLPCVLQQLGGYCWPLPDGVIFVEPSFVDLVGYQLNPGSLAIDAGDPDVAYNDKIGQGSERNDMGCYGGPNPIEW